MRRRGGLGGGCFHLYGPGAGRNAAQGERVFLFGFPAQNSSMGIFETISWGEDALESRTQDTYTQLRDTYT